VTEIIATDWQRAGDWEIFRTIYHKVMLA